MLKESEQTRVCLFQFAHVDLHTLEIAIHCHSDLRSRKHSGFLSETGLARREGNQTKWSWNPSRHACRSTIVTGWTLRERWSLINRGRCLQQEKKLLGSTPKNPWVRVQGWKGICRSCFMSFVMLLGCLTPFLFLFK